MSRLIFKSEMYKKTISVSGFDCLYTSTECAQQSQQIFDEWLEKQKIVWGTLDKENNFMIWNTQAQGDGDTHKAYLICIEEIKECEHEPADYRGHGIWQCIKCNKQLKPKNGWEEI